ncbi:MAG TPA: ATP-binding protein [Solirubrobacteraceae bacterium]|nr:ATP-binding protein [Solirubrobacteraceae bacterium]
MIFGAALVATTYVLFERATEYRQPQLPQVPRTPAIKQVKNGLVPLPLASAYSLPQLAKAQHQLATAQQQLARNLRFGSGHPLTFPVPRLEQDQKELTRDQHQLAQVQHQLSRAVHEIAQAGTAQAAQRASDSHELLVDSGIALAIVAVLALLAGWLVAGRMLRPIRTITRTARRISSASLHERLALGGPEDELKELGDTLDDLFDRLEASFEAQRQFAANASHELRTPLARQRALIQVALADPQASFSSLRAAHERVLASEQHLEQMIEALLTLTRGEAGPERREVLDLEALASQAVLARTDELADRGLEVHATLTGAATAGDPRLIERLIANLIDNAISHNSPRGRVEIATGMRDQRAFVSVANTGDPVPPEDIERLFQPFERLGNARTRHDNGHGLGLAIVHAIADAHGAQLTAGARPQGGLSVDVSFPPAGEATSSSTSGGA